MHIIAGMRIIVIIIFSCHSYNSFCRQETTNNTILDARIGGPNPLFSIGHNIQKRHHGLVRSFLFIERRNQGHSSVITHNGAYYGFTDRFTANIRIPIVKEQKSPPLQSCGIGNIHLQGEYAFYNHFDGNSLSQATVVGTIRFPTSNARTKEIDTINAWSFLVGITTSNWSDIWHLYSDFGLDITTTHHHYKLGNQFTYNLGMGRIIKSKGLKEGGFLLLELLADINGLYKRPDVINGKPNLLLGSMVTYLGPTFRFSMPSFVFLGGLQYPIAQVYRNPKAIRTHYKLGLGAAWLF